MFVSVSPSASARFKSRFARKFLIIAAILPIIGKIVPAAEATLTWDPLATPATGSDGSGTWANATGTFASGGVDLNWNNDNADAAVFGAGGSGSFTVTLGSNITTSGITFNAGPNYTIADNGFGITLAGTSPTLVSNGNGTFTGNVLGSAGLTYSGTGTLNLTGLTSTYTGNTTINGGTLAIYSGNGGGGQTGFDSNTNFIVNAGGAMVVAGTNALLGGSNGTSTVTVNGGTLTTADGVTSHIGTLTLNGGALNTGAPDGTYGSWDFQNSDVISVTANASMTVANMHLGSSPINVASGATLTITPIAGYSALFSDSQIIQNGAGTITISGYNQFTGNITVNGGTLSAIGQQTDGSFHGPLGNVGTAGRVFTVNAGGTLSLDVNNVLSGGNDTMPSIVVNGGVLTDSQYNPIGNITLNGGTMTSSSGSAGNYQAYQFYGADGVTVTGTSPSYISTTGDNNTGIHLGDNTTFNVNSTGSGSVDLFVSAPLLIPSSDFGSYASSLTKTGSGVMQLSNYNSFTGNVTVNGGTLSAAGVQTDGYNDGPLGNVATAGRVITINPGATLSLDINNVFSGGNDSMPSIIINGGTLNASQYNPLGNVTLNGGTITSTNTDGYLGGGYQAYMLYGNNGITVTGSSPSTISSAGDGAGVHLGANTPFNVGATGGTGPDLIVSAALNDQSDDFYDPVTFIDLPGGLTKSGNGVMQLTGANVYTGGTTITAGTLQVDSGTGSGSVSVNGGFLSGTGSIDGTVNVASGAAVAAGDSGSGALTVSALTFSAGGGAHFHLTSVSPSLVNVTNTLTLPTSGTVTVTLDDSPGVGKYELFAYGSLSMPGAVGASFTLVGGNPAQYSYSFYNDTSNDQIDLIVGVVPEPASAVFVLAGGAMLLRRRRSREMK